MPEEAAETMPAGLIAGPPWAPGIDDLARLRALSRKNSAVIHSELRGASMGAALPDGSRIRIRAGADDAWHPGDVIAFFAGSRIMAHRVVYEGRHGEARRYLITQGDGNWLCDPPVNRATVVGRVEAYCTAGDWLPVGEPVSAFPRHMIAGLSLAVMRALLELSPAFTIRVSRLMSWVRMGPRLVMARLRQLSAHVRP